MIYYLGFKSASDYDERRGMRIDCDKVFDGIILGNGDTICNIQYLKGIGVATKIFEDFRGTLFKEFIMDPGLV